MKMTIITKTKSILIISVLMLTLSIQVSATAGSHRTNNSNESYDSISEIPGNLCNRNPKQRDSSFAISPDEVLYKLKQKQKITLVDVRNPEDFARLHMPGSLNIPLYAIKTKFFLKSFIIVLINEELNFSRLETECRKLKDMGFKAFILDGGLDVLKQKRSPLVGDLLALEEMKVVSPQVFFREKDCENTLVIDISPVQTEISRQLMPNSKHIPVPSNPGQWVRRLNRIITDHKNQPFLSVVVFNETGDGYEGVNKILAGIGVNAFCLQGGVTGYKRYLEDLMLSWLPRDSRIKTNSICRTCSEKIEENIITKARE